MKVEKFASYCSRDTALNMPTPGTAPVPLEAADNRRSPGVKSAAEAEKQPSAFPLNDI